MQSKQSLVVSNANILYCSQNLNCDHLKYAEFFTGNESYGRKPTFTLCNAALIGKSKQFTKLLKP